MDRSRRLPALSRRYGAPHDAITGPRRSQPEGAWPPPKPHARAVRSTSSPPRWCRAKAGARARLMLVGEQPGDQEDLAGKPFVGPAGPHSRPGAEEAGIARDDAFVTNAVKHFKFEQRGKRRLHKRPNAYEIERCQLVARSGARCWCDPAAIVALGATAARSLFGRVVTITQHARQSAPAGRWHGRLRHHPSVVPAADQG